MPQTKQFTLEQRKELTEILENLEEESLITEWNGFCDWNNDPDSSIEELDRLDDLFYGRPLELVSLIDCDSFDLNDPYFTCSDGWIVTTDRPLDWITDYDFIVDFIESETFKRGYWSHADEVEEFMKKIKEENGGE